MKTQEAIKKLIAWKTFGIYLLDGSVVEKEKMWESLSEALDMAIEALRHKKNCELTAWGECSYTETGCSECSIKAKITKALICNESDDLISRQAAIDSVEESRRLNHHKDGKEACAHEYEHRHFLKILRDLPSAQPEIKTDRDTISRKDAINAFKEWVTSGEANMRAFANALMYERLKNLPSVQDEIIRCKDCKYHEPPETKKGGHYCCWFDSGVEENDYCSYGERGEQDDSRTGDK